MKHKIIIAAFSILIFSCGKTIVEKTYLVNTVFVNDLHQPIVITMYEGKTPSAINIKARDSAVISERSEEGTAEYLYMADSAMVSFGIYKKMDRHCSTTSGDNTACLSDQANLLTKSQYAYSNKNGTHIYRYVVGAKDSLEAVSK